MEPDRQAQRAFARFHLNAFRSITVATVARPPRYHSAVALDEMKNFLPIGTPDGNARIGTAGQPTEDELREVAADGYRAMVNLGLLNPEYCLPDEAGLAASLGLAYRHLPVDFDAPALADFEAFVAQMDAWSNERVFVHCAANFRVSSFMAVYGELRLGWTGTGPIATPARSGSRTGPGRRSSTNAGRASSLR